MALYILGPVATFMCSFCPPDDRALLELDIRDLDLLNPTPPSPWAEHQPARGSVQHVCPRCQSASAA